MASGNRLCGLVRKVDLSQWTGQPDFSLVFHLLCSYSDRCGLAESVQLLHIPKAATKIAVIIHCDIPVIGQGICPIPFVLCPKENLIGTPFNQCE